MTDLDSMHVYCGVLIHSILTFSSITFSQNVFVVHVVLLFDCGLISLSCKSIGKKLASDNARNQVVAPGSLSKELKVYRHLKQYTFENLKLATWGFRFRLGVGILGSVYKGWVSRTGTSPSRPTTGLPVAVKILNKNGSQGHHEFVVWNYLYTLINIFLYLLLVIFFCCMDHCHHCFMCCRLK